MASKAWPESSKEIAGRAEGSDDHAVRVVSTNAARLNLASHGFEVV